MFWVMCTGSYSKFWNCIIASRKGVTLEASAMYIEQCLSLHFLSEKELWAFCNNQIQPSLHSSCEGRQSPNPKSFYGTNRTFVVQLSWAEVQGCGKERWKGIYTLQLRHLSKGRARFVDKLYTSRVLAYLMAMKGNVVTYGSLHCAPMDCEELESELP